MDAGVLSESMTRLLRGEIPECTIVTSSHSATLALAVIRHEDRLDVNMVVPPTSVVLARRIALDRGDPEPALRRVALLAARAVESSAHLGWGESAREGVQGGAFHLSIEASVVTQWWASSREPRFGPALALTMGWGSFGVGVWTGLFALDDRQVEGLHTRATEWAVLARGVWRPLRIGSIGLGAEWGGGIGAIWLRAVPEGVLGAIETRVQTVEGWFRGGFLVEMWMAQERFHLFARGGGLFRLGDVEIIVPPSYGDDRLRTGVATPWVELGLSLRFL